MAKNVQLKSLDHRATLEVTVDVTRQFRFRAWLAKQLFKLGAKVLGCDFKWSEV